LRGASLLTMPNDPAPYETLRYETDGDGILTLTLPKR
jgi:hypothetical protein